LIVSALLRVLLVWLRATVRLLMLTIWRSLRWVSLLLLAILLILWWIALLAWMMLIVVFIPSLSRLLSVLESAFVGTPIFAASILVLLRRVAAAVLLPLWWIAALGAAVGWVVVVVRAGHYLGSCEEGRLDQGQVGSGGWILVLRN